MKKLSIILILFLYLFQFSCSQEENLDVKPDEMSGEAVPQRIVTKLQEAGFFTSEGLFRDGDGYIVEFDVYLTEKNIDELISSMSKTDNGRTKHYRTTNLVSVGGSPRTINVHMDPAFASSIQSAFDVALTRYNNENLGLRFQRTTNVSAANIRFVAFFEVSNLLGRSTFPSGGNPGSEIRLNTYHYNNTPRADAVTTIAHEVGHAIGFRHTDYMNRSYSCGGGGLEPDPDGVGAVHIPGTPTVPAPNSWMLACSNGTDRPFTSDDRTALRTIYPVPVTPGGSILLSSGQELRSNQSVTTSDGQFTLVMQGDGNLVVYRGSQPIWASNTAGNPITRCAMQSDGNLVLYGGDGTPYWHTQTYMYPGGYLAINNSGVLSIIQNGVVRWTSSNTPTPTPSGNNVLRSGESLSVGQTRVSTDNRFTLTMQGDGNLVLYQGSQPLWASHTSGTPATLCVMQSDGNLVLYGSNGTPYWSTGTHMYPGAILELENNGNMRITQNGTQRWSSNTCCR